MSSLWFAGSLFELVYDIKNTDHFITIVIGNNTVESHLFAEDFEVNAAPSLIGQGSFLVMLNENDEKLALLNLYFGTKLVFPTVLIYNKNGLVYRGSERKVNLPIILEACFKEKALIQSEFNEVIENPREVVEFENTTQVEEKEREQTNGHTTLSILKQPPRGHEKKMALLGYKKQLMDFEKQKKIKRREEERLKLLKEQEEDDKLRKLDEEAKQKAIREANEIKTLKAIQNAQLEGRMMDLEHVNPIPHPKSSESGIVSIKFYLPNGKKPIGKFNENSRLGEVFDWLKSNHLLFNIELTNLKGNVYSNSQATLKELEIVGSITLFVNVK